MTGFGAIGSIIVMMYSPGLLAFMSNFTRSPGLRFFGSAPGAIPNPISIADHFSAGIGSWFSVIRLPAMSISTTEPSPLAVPGAPPPDRFLSALNPPSAALRLLSESIRKLARVTTVSPSFTPDSTSTKPSPRVPSFTSRGSKRPSPSATSTTCRVPLSMTAESGTVTTSRFGPASICTVPYIPGLSFPCGFASSMRTRAVRVSVLSIG